MYRDSMDPTRLVSPEKLEGKNYQCRVYFQAQNKGKHVSYVGQTTLAAHLFDQSNPKNKEIGFVQV